MNRFIYVMLLTVYVLLPFHYLITTIMDYRYVSYWKEFILSIVIYTAFLGILINRKKFSILFDKINFPVFLFVSFTIFLLFFHYNELALRGVAGYVLYAITYFVLITHIKIQRIVLILRVLIFVGLVLSVGAIIQMFISNDLFGLTAIHSLAGEGIPRVGSLMGKSPILLGWYLAMLFPVAFVFYLLEHKKKLSGIYQVSAFVLLAGMILTFTRAALLQVLIALSFIFIMNRKYRFKSNILKPFLIVISICLVLLISITTVIPIKDLTLDTISNRFVSGMTWQGAGNLGRIHRWKTTLSFISNEGDLIFGSGPGLGWHFATYNTVQSSPILKIISQNSRGYPAIESFSLQLITELGVIGFLAFVFLYVGFIIRGYRLIGFYRDKSYKYAAICLGVTAGLLGLSVTLIVTTSLISWPMLSLFWLYCAAITILHRISEKKDHIFNNY